MYNYKMLIDGVQVAGDEGRFDVINPATGKAFAQCPAGSLQQLDQAVSVAQTAFKSWRNSSHPDRCERLMAIAADIEQEVESLARLIMLEQGKPLELAFSEIMGAASNLKRLTLELGGNDAQALATRLESGVAWANCHAQIQPKTPFGGSKMSGFGVEFGLEGLLEFTGQQLLFVRKQAVKEGV